jgi:hypothetical protein
MDTNKQTRSVSLDPELVEYVHGLVGKNTTNFTAEIEKSIKLRKANEDKHAYAYSTELEGIPISSVKGRSQGFWIRECAIGIYRLLEYFQQKDLDAANEKAKDDKKATTEAKE